MCVLETSNDPICLFWCLGQKTFLERQQPMSVQTTITEHSDAGALLIKVKVCKNGMKNGLKIGKKDAEALMASGTVLYS